MKKKASSSSTDGLARMIEILINEKAALASLITVLDKDLIAGPEAEHITGSQYASMIEQRQVMSRYNSILDDRIQIVRGMLDAPPEGTHGADTLGGRPRFVQTTAAATC